MSKAWLASRLGTPKQLIDMLPKRIDCTPFAKQNDLKPRAIYPIEPWTCIIEGIVVGAMEQALDIA